MIIPGRWWGGNGGGVGRIRARARDSISVVRDSGSSGADGSCGGAVA